MVLNNVSVLGLPGNINIVIHNGRIQAVVRMEEAVAIQKNDIHLFFRDAIAFPGLINSHDHLDFNLFPLLGNKIYTNYTEWGKDIHEQHSAAIKEVLKVPQMLRTQWGVYKNLLNGVTTVVNHGTRVAIANELINVFQHCHVLHSPGFEKRWKWKLNNPFGKNFPVAIHVGEGTDAAASNEIDELIKWNILNKNIIGIHGVAMNNTQAAHFKALVWCPASNYFLLNKTAAVSSLKNKTTILFGTDATLTGDWNLWKQLRLAREQRMMTDEELLEMLSTSPAAIWQLKDTGRIAINQQADIVVAKTGNKESSMDAFFSLNPEDILLVLHKGRIKLFDELLLDQLTAGNFNNTGYGKITVGKSNKYVAGNLPALMETILKYYPKANFPVSAA